MILTIISFLVLIAGIVSSIIVNKKYGKKIYEVLDFVSFGAILFGMAAVITTVTLICVANIGSDVKVKNNELRYEYLEQERIDRNPFLYEDALEYNHDVFVYQKFGTSKWTNWFFYNGCDEIQYFEVDGGYDYAYSVDFETQE